MVPSEDSIPKTNEENKKDKTCNFDIIVQELGSFGKYQSLNLGLVAIIFMFGAVFNLSYIFTTSTPSYRCHIAECEKDYNLSRWLSLAIPQKLDGTFEQCTRYAPIIKTEGNLTLSCTIDSFDKSKEVTCENFTYETPEFTIANEWNLLCNWNKWKLTLVGTVNHVGQFFSLLILGIVSDTYGRKTVLIIGMVSGGICGIIRALSVNYYMFVAFEFIDLLFSASTMHSAFILGMELINPKYRVFAGTVIGCFYPLGGMLMALVGYYFHYWRDFLLVLYVPALISSIYTFFVPESIRWLLSMSKMDKVKAILHKVSKINNKKELSPHILGVLQDISDGNNERKLSYTSSLALVMKNKRMLGRLFNCTLCFFANSVVYFGLNVKSISLSGNRYYNFAMTNFVEIPAHFLAFFMMNNLGRRYSITSTLILTGLCCIGAEFISIECNDYRFILYLIGKFSITTCFTVLYIYGTEIFPTNVRNSLIGICVMVSRLGSIIAPQTPVLDTIHSSFSMILFGIIAIISGILSTKFPETLNKKLPDTFEEALDI